MAPKENTENEICSNTLDLSLDLIQTDYQPCTIENDIQMIQKVNQYPSFFKDKAILLKAKKS